MIEVKIPKEITNYKEKLFFNLSLRQTICTLVAVGINVPLYFFGKKYISEDLLSWLVILIAVPIMLTGYFKYNGLTFEKFVLVIVKTNFIYPQKRIYETENLYEIINQKIKGDKKYVQTIIKEEKTRKTRNTQVMPKDYSIQKSI